MFHQVFPAINVRPPSDRSFSATDSSRRRPRHAGGEPSSSRPTPHRGDGKTVLTHANSDDFVPLTTLCYVSTIGSPPPTSIIPPLERNSESSAFVSRGRHYNNDYNNDEDFSKDISRLFVVRKNGRSSKSPGEDELHYNSKQTKSLDISTLNVRFDSFCLTEYCFLLSSGVEKKETA